MTNRTMNAKPFRPNYLPCQWFCDHRWYDLLVIMDDATSEIYYAQLVEEESTRTVMAGLREVIEQRGGVVVRANQLWK